MTQAIRIKIILVLGLLSSFGPLAIDIYLPALPTISADLGATEAAIQGTLAAFLLGFALGQGIHGPLSDRYGRKPPLYMALGLFIVTSAGCAMAASADALILLRFLQSLGACAGVVIARAVIRDSFDNSEAAPVYATMMLVSGLAPILAPLIGAQILLLFGWRAMFWLLALVGVIALISVRLLLPESRKVGSEGPRALSFGNVLGGYFNLLRQRQFMGPALVASLATAGMFAYITGSPFVFIELHGLAPASYGLLFGANAVAILLLAQINGRFLLNYNKRRIITVGISCQLIAALILFVAGISGWGGLPVLIGCLLVYVGSVGLIGPNATILAMAPYSVNAGAASALFGMLQFGLGAIAATAASLLADGTAGPMCGTIATCAILAVLIRGTVMRRI